MNTAGHVERKRGKGRPGAGDDDAIMAFFDRNIDAGHSVGAIAGAGLSIFEYDPKTEKYVEVRALRGPTLERRYRTILQRRTACRARMRIACAREGARCIGISLPPENTPSAHQRVLKRGRPRNNNFSR